MEKKEENSPRSAHRSRSIIHSAIAHGGTCFREFALPERFAIFSTLIGYQSNDDKSNDRYACEDAKTYWKDGH